MEFKFGDVVRWRPETIKDRSDAAALAGERLMLIYAQNEYAVQHPIWYALPLDAHSRDAYRVWLADGKWVRAGEPYIELDEES